MSRAPAACLAALVTFATALLGLAPPAAARPDDAAHVRSWSAQREQAVASPVRVDRVPEPRSESLPRRSGTGKRVVYSISRQQVWLVGRGGRTVRTYAVSGRTTQPGPGRYRVWSRSLHTSSAVSTATMDYMVRFARGRRTGAAIGFHDIPRDSRGRPEQRLRDLGRPLSAGCIRQSTPDARALWRFAPVGTRVVVLP